MTESSPQNNKATSVCPTKGLLWSGVVVSSMTMLSRVLGLVRDVVFASTIGAQAEADAFFVAFKIPNFLRRLFAEGAFAQAFVPVLSEYREKGSIESVRGFLNRVCGCLALILLGLTLLVLVAAPAVTMVFAPGFWNDPFKFHLTQDMLRITFPYLLLISLTGFAGAVLNSYDRFAIPALTPVLLNICLISAAVWVSPYFDPPVVAIAWGVLISGVVQLTFQLPFLKQIHLLPVPKVDFKDPGVKKVLLLMAPAILGVSVAQINLLFDTVLASFLPTGSVSWLYYSDRLVELPLGTFAIAIGTVILPSLSRQYVNDDKGSFNQTMDWALRWVLLIALPATVGLIILSQPILTLLFEYGKTSAHDTAMASLSLKAYSMGLLAFMLIKVLVPGYFSRQDTKTPVKIGIKAMGLNMLFNILLVIPFHFWWNIGHVGLALATSFSAVVNAGLLYRGLRENGVYQPLSGWGWYLFRLLLANIVMAAILLGSFMIVADWSVLSVWERSMAMVATCVTGVLVYFICLLVLGMRLSDFNPYLPR
ncbi:murein biosynthesis integral membrane protein MurJ [Candidatus Endobugula sertula]|uniref:Probable lipid II flippase MurJ n=1 Tax=Candidatus Endobugula sertula TaxID=62101 RepID=A0A1D2QTI3_9GAMM|nr:murein biosynthesis integral membrane protein MurJ [Candidatus Endobugula sertula]